MPPIAGDRGPIRADRRYVSPHSRGAHRITPQKTASEARTNRGGTNRRKWSTTSGWAPSVSNARASASAARRCPDPYGAERIRTRGGAGGATVMACTLSTRPGGGPPAGKRRDPGEGRRGMAEALSSGLRLAPSPGAHDSNGILRRRRRPRVHKRGPEHRLRGSRPSPSERSGMRFVGIDVAAEPHVVAVVDETGAVGLKPTPFTEDAAGYQQLFDRLGVPTDTLVAMAATGHYWKNLFAALVARGFAVALLNPRRTHRFAGEDLRRTQTDAIAALGIAHFAAQKRPPATRLPDRAVEELRQLVRFRDRLVQDLG